MNIIEKLKSLGVEVTEDITKALGGEWISQAEVDKKTKKLEALEVENTALKERDASLQTKITDLQKQSGDAEGLQAKITELSTTLETERKDRAAKDEAARKDRAAKDEAARLGTQVDDFFADKHFVNSITADSIKSKLIDELGKDTAKGRSIKDIFDSMVNGEDGKPKADILIDDKTFNAQKKRSQIIGAPAQTGGQPLTVSKEEFLKMGLTARSKLKEEDPDMYEKLKKEIY